MAIFSSHILNSLTGLHATNVSISIFKTNSIGEKNLFFENSTDENGRIIKEFYLSNDDCRCTFEIIVKTGDYFKKESKEIYKQRIVSEIVIRFKMENPNKKYHIPIIVSPNSYSILWSE